MKLLQNNVLGCSKLNCFKATQVLGVNELNCFKATQVLGGLTQTMIWGSEIAKGPTR